MTETRVDVVKTQSRSRREDGVDLPLLVWRFAAPRLTIASAPVGGGIGLRHWTLNAQVVAGYDRLDGVEHLRTLAADAGLRGDGVAMMTAADMADAQATHDDGVDVVATVGLGVPTWAAAPDEVDPSARHAAGTINVVVFLPVRLSEAALVNAVATVTEAKTQALLDAAVPGTGTATDAVCVSCPVDGPAEPFGGPRSVWGARIARATYAAVAAGTPLSLARIAAVRGGAA